MEQQEVNQFTWFPTYTKAIEKLPDEASRAYMCMAIMEYASLGKEPNFEDARKLRARVEQFVFESVFEAIRINIDNSVKHYTNGMKGKSGGSKGGRPKNGETKEQAYERRNKEAAEADPDPDLDADQDAITEPADIPADCHELDLNQNDIAIVDYIKGRRKAS